MLKQLWFPISTIETHVLVLWGCGPLTVGMTLKVLNMIFILCFMRGIKVSRYENTHTHASTNIFMHDTKGNISSNVFLEVMYCICDVHVCSYCIRLAMLPACMLHSAMG
jgi:hypothetical protein